MHILYETEDTDRPNSICDRNGEVTLGLCKVCGGAEASLTTHCPNRKLTEDEERKIIKGDLDFLDGMWIIPGNSTQQKQGE